MKCYTVFEDYWNANHSFVTHHCYLDGFSIFGSSRAEKSPLSGESEHQTVSVIVGARTGGTFQWKQVLLSTHITLTENTGNVLAVQGANVIDNQFAYPFVYNGFLEDSPDVRLEPDLQRVTRQDSFMTYLMFRPSGTNTIWVPLRQIPWSWNASATRTGTPNTWVLDAGSNHSVGADVNSTAEPLWSGSTRDLRAQ